ncbi:MAG: hypothetical protein ACYDA6_06265, partial [Solirubrobacteraceae bacterium]
MRSLLRALNEDPALERLAGAGGHAYVASALRPFLVAALAERVGGAGTPDGTSAVEASGGEALLVVVGDDRAARDMAAELRVWLDSRTVRYYPSRGVSYESHLIPPPHLVGLRMAALDALLAHRAHSAAGTVDGNGAQSAAQKIDLSLAAPVVVISAAALAEKVPD